MELIGAVLNCPDWFNEAAALLDRGFASWRMASVLNAGETVRAVPVTGGIRDAVRAVAQADAAAPVAWDAWPDLLIDLPDSLAAPIRQGQVIGTVRLTDQGETLLSVPLIAGEAVPERSFRYAGERILSLWPVAGN